MWSLRKKSVVPEAKTVVPEALEGPHKVINNVGVPEALEGTYKNTEPKENKTCTATCTS